MLQLKRLFLVVEFRAIDTLTSTAISTNDVASLQQKDMYLLFKAKTLIHLHTCACMNEYAYACIKHKSVQCACVQVYVHGHSVFAPETHT